MMLEVRVQPRAKRDSIKVAEGQKVRVRVTAAPAGGKANEAVIALLAKRLGVPKRDVTILRGHRARDKVLSVRGLSSQEAMSRLAAR